MPVIQLCALAPDITGLNSLTCFPIYLIAVVWLQEWRLRGDRMGLLRNSVDFCMTVLQKLSERWASAGISSPNVAHSERYLVKLRHDSANVVSSSETLVMPSLCPCVYPGVSNNEGLVRISILQNLLQAIKIYGGESP